MNTVLLLNIKTFNNPDYDDEWQVFFEWTKLTGTQHVLPAIATRHNWKQIYTFQLLVKEARKDE